MPLELQDVVLRVAHELVGNAVKHGMHVRLLGRIEVRVETRGQTGIRLDVADDGWGCGRDPSEGEGLKLAGLLAGERGGRVTLERVGDRTVATLCCAGVAPWGARSAAACRPAVGGLGHRVGLDRPAAACPILGFAVSRLVGASDF